MKKFSPSYRDFLVFVNAEIEPTQYTDAMSHPKWRTGMKKEVATLEKNGIWMLNFLPSVKHAIGCKWVYGIKYKANGIIGYKAHLVVLNNT